MTSKTAPALFWFRQDFRLSDNDALFAAAKAGPVVALYVLDETLDWSMGAASRWWLHGALEDLATALAKHKVKLVLRKGAAKTIVPQVAKQAKAAVVFWNRVYEPAARKRDDAIEAALKKAGIGVEVSHGNLLFEPWEVKNKSGKPFKVYTPFARACRAGLHLKIVWKSSIFRNH